MNLLTIPVTALKPNVYEDGSPMNLRGDVGDTTEIQNSYWESDIPIEPLKVTQPVNDVYTIIDGHRRFTAISILLERAKTEQRRLKKMGAEKAGDRLPFINEKIERLSYVPVLVTDIQPTETDAFFDMMLLSFNRKNLDPVTLAKALQRLREKHNWSVLRMALRLGMDVSAIEQILNTLNASPSMQVALRSGAIALGTYDRFFKGATQDRQERILATLNEKEQAPTGKNVLSVIRAERNQTVPNLPAQFLDLEVMPALNAALERLRFAISKRAQWSDSTCMAAESILLDLNDLVVEALAHNVSINDLIEEEVG